jgi:hypothetical protein
LIVSINRLFAVLVLAAFGGACERQSYQETRMFTHHGEHAADSTGHAKKNHSGADSTAKPAEHK